MVLKKLNSFRRKKFDVEGGAYIEAMVCSDCIDLDIDPNEMESAIKKGWEATWHQEGKSKKEIRCFEKDLPKLKKQIKKQRKE